MQERIIEIIVYLLTKIHQDGNRRDKVDLTHALQLNGYTEVEINLAFSWIFKHLQQPAGEKIQNNFDFDQNMSDMPDLEQLVISPDAYGYLIQLIHLGIMKDEDMEMFVERALAFGKEDISVDDLKSIVASIIFDLDNHTSFNGYSFYSDDIPLQ